jgi:hypothetical protein
MKVLSDAAARLNNATGHNASQEALIGTQATDIRDELECSEDDT